jgi:hypothetical protein
VGCMKPLSQSLFKLFSYLLIIVCLQSCSTEVGIWRNEQINQSKLDDLHQLNRQVFECLKSNNTKKLESYLSKELLDDRYTLQAVGTLNNALQRDSFMRLDEYYVQNKYILADTITVKNNGINNYSLIYPGTAQEMYINLLVPKTNTPNRSMITIIYAHYDYGWKVSTLDINPYLLNGKTAPELFQLAKKEYDSGYLLSAANTITQATTCTRPNSIWKYAIEDGLYKFFDKATGEANNKYHYPIILNEVSTRPRIIRIYNKTTNEGTYPIICYLTKINLKDVAAIERENNEIKKKIGLVMPGIDKNKTLLHYAAYNEMMSNKASVPHYDITDKLQ